MAGHLLGAHKKRCIMSIDDGMILKALVEQIIVDDNGIEIHFKCGVVIEKELE
jgi:hypothetical protein